MNGHTLTVRIAHGQIELDTTCHEPLGADCRMTCPEGCEEWDPNDHEHELVPQPSGVCNVVDWLDNVDMEESFEGPAATLATGLPIKVSWDGDGYVWSMA